MQATSCVLTCWCLPLRASQQGAALLLISDTSGTSLICHPDSARCQCRVCSTCPGQTHLTVAFALITSATDACPAWLSLQSALFSLNNTDLPDCSGCDYPTGQRGKGEAVQLSRDSKLSYSATRSQTGLL